MYLSSNLLLIRPNDQKNIYGDTFRNAACEPPFWIATITAYLKDQGIESIKIIDAEALNESPAETSDKVKQFNPRLIGIIVTGTNLSASTQKMHGAGLLAKTIKSVVEIPIFVWGLHPSALPMQTLKEEAIDYVIKGEGLESIRKLVLYNIDKRVDINSIEGLYYKDDSGLHFNEGLNLTNINSMPKPDWSLLPYDKYKAHNWQRLKRAPIGREGYGIIATTLGCPFNCEFCAVSTLFGQHKVRFKKPEQVREEIDVLVNQYNVYYIKIIDECFVLNKKYVMEICDLLIDRGYDIDIWAYARVDTVDEEILSKLKEANINWLAYGIESANDHVLKGVSKGQYSLEKTKSVMNMTKAAGINILANFMFGLPDDTIDSMKETLGLAREINPEFINMYCTMAYPGSALYNSCIQNGIKLPRSWLGYAQLSFECQPLPTKYLNSEEVLAFRDYAFNAFFENNVNYFDNIYRKFGENGVKLIEDMLRNKVKRKLLEKKDQEIESEL